MPRKLETALPFDNHRSTPMSAAGQFGDILHASGVVDYLWLWDELSAWFPPHLWRPEITPMAAALDMHSTYDPFVEAAYVLARNPKMGVRLSTDSLRSGPGELLRRMLSLANCTEGPVAIAIGAGELRQAKPFGYKRSEGLARMEDTFRIIRALYDGTEPVTHEGKHWHYQNAFIGNSRPQRRPEFWALGGGPMLLDIAARYADGFEFAVPQGVSTPEAFAKIVKSVREKVESYGRDPGKFGFGIWFHCLRHEDTETLDKVMDNPIIKYFSGLIGRIDNSQWAAEGFAPVMPVDWNYAMKWLPYEQTATEIDDIVARVPREMVRKAYHCGTPQQLTKLGQEYVEAGANFIGTLDLTPLVLGPAEGEPSLRRGIEMYAALKKQAASRA